MSIKVCHTEKLGPSTHVSSTTSSCCTSCLLLSAQSCLYSLQVWAFSSSRSWPKRHSFSSRQTRIFHFSKMTGFSWDHMSWYLFPVFSKPFASIKGHLRRERAPAMIKPGARSRVCAEQSGSSTKAAGSVTPLMLNTKLSFIKSVLINDATL